jgi:putative membrane protein (TIGR04086 family)
MKGGIIMHKSHKGRKKQASPWRPIFWMPLITMILTVILAQLILWNKIPENAQSVSIKIIILIVALWGANRGVGLAPRNSFLWGILNAAAYGILLMLSNLLFFGEPFFAVGETFLWILGGAMLGILLGNIKRR